MAAVKIAKNERKALLVAGLTDLLSEASTALITTKKYRVTAENVLLVDHCLTKLREHLQEPVELVNARKRLDETLRSAFEDLCEDFVRGFCARI